MEFNGTFLASIVSFVIFVFIMNKILYSPIDKIVNKRKSFIDENYQIASDNNLKSEELLKEHDENLAKAKEDAKSVYINSVEDYKAKASVIIEDAKEKSKGDLLSVNESLISLSNETKNGIKARLNELASDIVEKVIGLKTEVQGFNDEDINNILYR